MVLPSCVDRRSRCTFHSLIRSGNIVFSGDYEFSSFTTAGAVNIVLKFFRARSFLGSVEVCIQGRLQIFDCMMFKLIAKLLMEQF